MFPTWNFSLTQFNLVVLEKFETRCKMAKIWSKLNFRTDKKKAWILENECPENCGQKFHKNLVLQNYQILLF